MKNAIDKSQLYDQLKKAVESQSGEFFGHSKDAPHILQATNYFFSDEGKCQNFRFDDLVVNGAWIGDRCHLKILDMASGFGQFVLEGLSRGLDIWGLEPGKDQIDFIRRKVKVFGMPAWYSERFVQGVGENIPFPDGSFDYITSFQTLEHVQDVQRVTDSLIRIIRSGGGIHIRCPNYIGTFEGHYLMPWLPFPATRPIMRVILMLLRRPIKGIDQDINYITQDRLVGCFVRSAISSGAKILITDNLRLTYEWGLRRRGIPVFPGAAMCIKAIMWVRDLFRRETNIDLFVRVIKPSDSIERELNS